MHANKAFAALLGGVSIIALSSGSAFAQTVTVDGVTPGPLITDASGNLTGGATGLTFNGAAPVSASPADGTETLTTTSVAVDGSEAKATQTAITTTYVGGVANPVTSTTTNTATVSGSGFEATTQVNDGINPITTTGSVAITGAGVAATGIASISTVSGDISTTSGNISTTTGTVSGQTVTAGTGGITSTGLATLSGGATITGGTTTDTLAVSGASSFGGNSDYNGNRITNLGGPIAAGDATNKAYVDFNDALLNDRIKDVRDGVAIALAIQTPDLVAGEKFGVSVNFGTYDGSNAIGIGLQGVLGKNLFGAGERIAATGGVGFSTERDNVAGRAGLQFTW
ncbi:YadA-like family protein [Rhodomicrobium udaipurense]|nr:YadA-like family protein [Rhodomicrobium udaipurense]